MQFLNLTFEFIGITGAIQLKNVYIVTNIIATSQVAIANKNLV